MSKTQIQKQWGAIVCDLNSLAPEMQKFEDINVVYERHISSQLVNQSNPNYIKGITEATQPQFVQSLVISVLMLYAPKIVK